MSVLHPWLLITCALPMTAIAIASETAIDAQSSPIAGESLAKPLILRLNDEDFQTRESATIELWKLGTQVLPELKLAAESDQPEVAKRASELVRKIELDVFPDSNPELIDLIQQYPNSPLAEKSRILDRLKSMRAWRQMLRLFAADTDPNVRNSNAKAIYQIALLAAREELMKGNHGGAREMLELAPTSPSGLLALAEYHLTHGSLAAELQRAQSKQGEKSAAWRLALQRANGNLQAASNEARQANMPMHDALYQAMLGDPLPWFKQIAKINDEWNNDTHQAYVSLAVSRWQGDPRSMQNKEIAILRRSLEEVSSRKQMSARTAAFLLGMNDIAEKSLASESTIDGFWHLYSVEKNDEALQLLHVDPANPFSKTWVESRMGMLDKLAITEDSNHSPADELMTLAAFMELRGMQKEAYELFAPSMLALAEKDQVEFLDLIRNMILGGEGGVSALNVARELVTSWAGEQDERWQTIMTHIFGEHALAGTWWSWMPELMPHANRAERLEALMCLLTNTRDPKGLRQKCLESAWKLQATANDDHRRKLLSRISEWAFIYGDAHHALRAWDLMDPQGKNTVHWGKQMTYLSAAGRWNEVADIIVNQIKQAEQSGNTPSVELYAYAAATLRRADRANTAKVYDEWVQQLVLGDTRTALAVANGYAFAGDRERASYWYHKAMLSVDPESRYFVEIANRWCDTRGAPKEAYRPIAAVNELICSIFNQIEYQWERPLILMRQRVKADLYRALSLLGEDRPRAIQRLDQLHVNSLTDGALSDYFFPALNELGMHEEAGVWFERSWQALQLVLKKYPNSGNTSNTAAWLAARAQRMLPEAESIMTDVLSHYPHQSAYLDTMAEIQFAKGDRKGALQWSTQALMVAPEETELRRQHEHFLYDALPKRKAASN